MRPIPGCEGFYATRDGKILSFRTATIREISARPRKGYLHVNVPYGTDRASRRNEPVHKLVLMAWHGPKPFPEAQCRHLNGNSLDNRPENLVWGTCKENAADKVRHRTATWLLTGERSNSAKLSNVAVAEIRRRGALGDDFHTLAREFIVTAGYVRDIVNGRARMSDIPKAV